MIHFTETLTTPGWGEIPVVARSRSGSLESECLSFAPAADAHFAGVWAHWVDHIFRPHLLDAMVAVMSLARADHTRDLLVEDARVASVLPPETIIRLRRAGHAMLSRMEGLRGSRPALKLGAAADRGETPGLFPIVFALQSAIYNLPMRVALVAYARLEWRAARDAHGGPSDEPDETAAALVLSRIDSRLNPAIDPRAVAAAV